jgi:hypothetical protein
MFDKMPELIKATDLRGTITQAAAAQTNLLRRNAGVWRDV